MSPLAELSQKPEVIGTVFLTVGFFVLLVLRRLPNVQNISACANILNSKGGNLMLLAGLSLWFFAIAMRYIYFLIAMMVHKELTVDNAVALSGFNFVTGTAFGGAFGALLKAMSGETPQMPPAIPPVNEHEPTAKPSGTNNVATT